MNLVMQFRKVREDIRICQCSYCSSSINDNKVCTADLNRCQSCCPLSRRCYVPTDMKRDDDDDSDDDDNDDNNNKNKT